MARLRTLLSVVLPLLLCAALLGAMYFTSLDWQWVAFLSGVFVAAVLSLSSRATYAEWGIMRRSQQLGLLKKKMALQMVLCQRSEQLASDAEGRLDLLANSVPQPILYTDADETCRAHNTAMEHALGLSAQQIDGQPLRAVLGGVSYDCVKGWIDRALDGEEVGLQQEQRNDQGQVLPFYARYIPHRGGGERPLGFYTLLLPAAEAAATGKSALPGVIPAAESHALAFAFGLEDKDPAEPTETYEPLAEDVTRREDARFMEALRTDQFCLFQQPIVAVATGNDGPCHFEILVRLRDEERRLIPPGAFFGVAERFGLMPALDRWVVENLMRWYAGQEAGSALSLMRFHINLSQDSVCEESFPAFVRKQLAAHHVPRHTICFEIAESILLAHRDETIGSAHALRLLGCHIAIDGFGNASRSFADLKDMPLDFVKIDSSIVARILTDALSYAKARTISKVVHAMGARTIAECVEDAETLEKLRRIGVDFAQGFGIALPEPLASIAARDVTLAPEGSPRLEQPSLLA